MKNRVSGFIKNIITIGLCSGMLITLQMLGK